MSLNGRTNRRTCLAGATAFLATSARAGGEDLLTRKERVGEVPVLIVAPKNPQGRHLVMWISGFSGNKEGTQNQLRELARRGFVAMGIDAYQHGERAIEPVDQLRTRVRGNIRRYFWPILARTAEETPSLIDWAIREMGVRREAGIGGTSMGGDISVCAAGVDRRIQSVAALVATPDWLRGGSFEPPGEPDPAALADYERRNPLTHLEAYRHRPWITFESGAVDRQVPPHAGQQFVAALRETGVYPAETPRLRVTLHPEVPHRVVPAMFENAYRWFEDHLATSKGK